MSATDAEARVTNMGDGSVRPAFDVRFVTDTEPGVTVAVDLTHEATDARRLRPLRDQVERRTGGAQPAEVLADGSHTTLRAIDAAEARGVRAYAPVPQPRIEGIGPHARERGDTEPTAAWRARTGTAEALDERRASTAERVHADPRRRRPLAPLPLRGIPEGLACALPFALTHDVLRMFTPMARGRGVAAPAAPRPRRSGPLAHPSPAPPLAPTPTTPAQGHLPSGPCRPPPRRPPP